MDQFDRAVFLGEPRENEGDLSIGRSATGEW